MIEKKKTDWRAFEDAIISTQADMTLPEVQAMTGAENLAEALRRLTIRGSFRD